MLFSRLLERLKRARKEARRVKLTLFEEEGRREVSGILVPGKVPYFFSDDGEVRGHLCRFGGTGIHFIPDKG